MRDKDYEKEIHTVYFKLEELMKSVNGRLQTLDEDDDEDYAYVSGKLDGITMAYIILRKQIDGENFDE